MDWPDDMPQPPVAERVAVGVAFMNENDPGWHRADVPNPVDLERLDLGSAGDCVLGQRCPLEVLADYFGCDAGSLTPGDGSARYAAYLRHVAGNLAFEPGWSLSHGFNSDLGPEDFEALTAEWKRVIGDLRAAAVSHA